MSKAQIISRIEGAPDDGLARQLIEKAAKVAGYSCSWNARFECMEVWSADDTRKVFWQPHRDDGDAMRLAARLGMWLKTGDADSVTVGAGDECVCVGVGSVSREAALRIAILACAMFLANQMEG